MLGRDRHECGARLDGGDVWVGRSESLEAGGLVVIKMGETALRGGSVRTGCPPCEGVEN